MEELENLVLNLYDGSVPQTSVTYGDLLGKILKTLNGKPAVVYFYALWCEDCKSNEEEFRNFLGEVKRQEKPRIAILKCPISAEKLKDWKSDSGEPNMENRFRFSPYWIEEMPAAAVLRHNPQSPSSIEIVNGIRVFGQNSPNSGTLLMLYQMAKAYHEQLEKHI